jgi:hypothetical protein
MESDKYLQALREELAMVKASITALERLASSSAVRVMEKRRGRKSMGAAERIAVSERMRKYWAGYHSKKGSNGPTGT